MAKNRFLKKKRTLNLRGNLVEIQKPWVVGILNLTPDSFYDGGSYNNENQTLAQVEKMVREGADAIDIGAASTRPSAEILSSKKEKERLGNSVGKIRGKFPEVFISIDTYNSETARFAIGEGADIINDISGGNFDEKMPQTIGELGVPYVLMHIQKTPETMQQNPHYENVVKDVAYYFSKQIAKFLEAGANDLILDPGFGFGKNLEHNYELLQNIEHFKIFERLILVGLSRKSLGYKALKIKPKEALNATTVLHVLALERGADILRVHDVKEARQAVELVTFAQKFSR